MSTQPLNPNSDYLVTVENEDGDHMPLGLATGSEVPGMIREFEAYAIDNMEESPLSPYLFIVWERASMGYQRAQEVFAYVGDPGHASHQPE